MGRCFMRPLAQPPGKRRQPRFRGLLAGELLDPVDSRVDVPHGTPQDLGDSTLAPPSRGGLAGAGSRRLRLGRPSWNVTDRSPIFRVGMGVVFTFPARRRARERRPAVADAGLPSAGSAATPRQPSLVAAGP